MKKKKPSKLIYLNLSFSKCSKCKLLLHGLEIQEWTRHGSLDKSFLHKTFMIYWEPGDVSKSSWTFVNHGWQNKYRFIEKVKAEYSENKNMDSKVLNV